MNNDSEETNKSSSFRGFMILIKFSWILFVETLKYVFWQHKSYEAFIVSITNKLIQINILYVKLFQAFALNNNIIDEKINNTLIRFVDKAPWTESEIDYNMLTILEKEHNIIFDKPLQPINSGMISLVFKGKNGATGEEIVVKMKRKNIKQTLITGINDLLVFLNWMLYIPSINKFQIADVMSKNIDLIKHQTNFVQEVKNIQVFRKMCRFLKYIEIPNVDTSITDKYNDVIIMNFINGKQIGKIEEEDYNGFARVMMKFVFVSTFLYGKIHGDLHSGNILFIKDENSSTNKYKLGILDFGLIYEISSETKDGIFSIVSNLYNVPTRELSEIIINSSLIEPLERIKALEKEQYDNIITIISTFTEKNIKQNDKVNQMDVYKFLIELNDYIETINISQKQNSNQNQIKLKPSDDYVKIQLMFGMFHGVVIKLCDGKYLQLGNEIIRELFNTTEKENENE
jgi:predicted unusual protein kinase regulating ubiquinone biosynthesis (AarF/ABC1/UbiB family)